MKKEETSFYYYDLLMRLVVKLNASSENARELWYGFRLRYIYSLSDDDMWTKRWTSRFNDLCVYRCVISILCGEDYTLFVFIYFFFVTFRKANC